MVINIIATHFSLDHVWLCAIGVLLNSREFASFFLVSSLRLFP